MAALIFSDNPTRVYMHPLVSEIKILFDEADPVIFSEDQEEKQLPADSSYAADVTFHDGSCSSYQPNDQVYFGEGKSIVLSTPSGGGNLIAETEAGKTGEWS